MEELIRRDSNSVEELVSSIGDKFKTMDKDNLCTFVDFGRTVKENPSGHVKCGRKNISIMSV